MGKWYIGGVFLNNNNNNIKNEFGYVPLTQKTLYRLSTTQIRNPNLQKMEILQNFSPCLAIEDSRGYLKWDIPFFLYKAKRTGDSRSIVYIVSKDELELSSNELALMKISNEDDKNE
jgi:hypothetical protein